MDACSIAYVLYTSVGRVARGMPKHITVYKIRQFIVEPIIHLVLRRSRALIRVSIEDPFAFLRISSLSAWQITHFVYVINLRSFDSGGSGILKPEGLSFSLLAMEINLKHAPLNEIKFKAVTHCHKT